MKRKGFTLIEIMIVIVIIGILSVVLLRTYTRISQIVFRVQQTKNVHQEVLRVAQIVQNFADNNSIDFASYTDLHITQGIVDTLYLSGKDGMISFSMAGECDTLAIDDELILTGKCYLEMQQSGTTIQLTDPSKVNIRNLAFKIVPFASEYDYLYGDVPCDKGYLHCIHKPGFRLLMDAYSINYGTQRTNRVHIPVQLFY